jgi:hypothetical protein
MDMKEYTDAKSAKETKHQGGRPGNHIVSVLPADMTTTHLLHTKLNRHRYC